MVLQKLMVFQKILDESGCKPNKIWVDKGSEFYNRSRGSGKWRLPRTDLNLGQKFKKQNLKILNYEILSQFQICPMIASISHYLEP